MKKPRGRTGFARATGARELSFPEANFPRTKADIETWIVKCFFSSLKENGWEPFCLANPRQNEEQDFDYTVDVALYLNRRLRSQAVHDLSAVPSTNYSQWIRPQSTN